MTSRPPEAGAGPTGWPPFVGVVGAGVADPALEALAEGVGRHLGRLGAVVVCGGLGGVMAAACRGARHEGAATVGILPGEDRRAANPWVTVPVPTGLGELRNGLLVRASEALVAVGGEYGTLSEVALALKTGCPVVGLGTWGLVRPDGTPDRSVVPAEDAAGAAVMAVALAKGRRETPERS